jgi:hypothetical protein
MGCSAPCLLAFAKIIATPASAVLVRSQPFEFGTPRPSAGEGLGVRGIPLRQSVRETGLWMRVLEHSENIQLCTPPHPSPALGRGEPNSIRGSGMKTIFTLFCVRQQSNYCTTKETFSVSDAPEAASVVSTFNTYWPF